MIRYSQMHKIIQDTTASFLAKKKVHLKVSTDILERDKMLFKYKRYETWPLADFKLFVLWIAYSNSSSKFDTFDILNNQTSEDHKNFRKLRDKIAFYKITLKDEIEYLSTKVINKNNLLKILNRGEITPISAYYYLSKMDNFTRLQQRKIDQLEVFFEFLPKIRDYIRSY